MLTTKSEVRGIEITFPVAVEMTNDDGRVLDALAGEMCERWKRAHPGRIMWPAGMGSKILYMPITKAEEDAGRHIEFSDHVFAIDCSEREDYDWLCAKCGIKQGDHKDCILDPPAGDCDFEPEKKDLGPDWDRGMVPMRVYLSAVNGRREMRAALVASRARVKDLEKIAEMVLSSASIEMSTELLQAANAAMAAPKQTNI